MAAIVYPATLPTPQSSTVTPVERRALGSAERPRDARALQRDRLDFERITWPPMEAAQSDAILTWWRDTLTFGGAWFAAAWPLPRGQVTAVRKFRTAPTWQFIAGGFWRLSAICEVRGVGELPQEPVAPPPSFLEDFEDGLGEYASITGDPDLYTITPTTYGDTLLCSPGAGASAVIARTLDQTYTVNRIRAKFRISDLDTDDSASCILVNGLSAVFFVTPRRDAVVDPTRRCEVNIDSEQFYATDSALAADTWYEVQIDLTAGEDASICRIVNLETETLVKQTAIDGDHDTVDVTEIRFQMDTPGPVTTTEYDEIEGYLDG